MSKQFSSFIPIIGTGLTVGGLIATASVVATVATGAFLLVAGINALDACKGKDIRKQLKKWQE